MARVLWLANGVSVYAATLRASRWCYDYVLVQRWRWRRRERSMRVLCYGVHGARRSLSSEGLTVGVEGERMAVQGRVVAV